jgi:spore coat polysaccharide biosynthesis predicted glycosyltransferase SpsG
MAEDTPRVILRADGSFEKGFGHLSRVLAIGEALEDEGCEIELVGEGFDAVLPQFSLSPKSVSSPSAIAGTAEDAFDIFAAKPDFVIVDGYDFTRDFFEVLESSRIPFLVIDDDGQTESLAPKMVVNQSPSAKPSLYARLNSETKFFLGPQYCLIRKEFEFARKKVSTIEKAGVFINFGASDPTFMTERALDIAMQKGLTALIALGPGALGREERERTLNQSGVQVSKPPNFAEDLAKSEIAIIAGGTAIWEAAFLGIPVVAMIVADNQRGPVLAAGKAHLVDWMIDTDKPEKQWQHELQQALFEYRADRPHYFSRAKSRIGIVANLGPRYLASQIRDAIL